MRTVSELVTYLSALPDDWGSWLVLADALAEAGDLRGELLVLEHQGEDVGPLVDDWLDSVQDELSYEDREQTRWLRTLAPLAIRAPADLAPVYARPVTQLLALLELRRWASELSPIFALHRERVIAATLAWIDRAFDSVPVPDEDHRTIHQAEAADNYDSCDRSRDHVGRWQDLPDEHLLANQWALAHLDEQGIRYYVPAVMSFALRKGPAGWITESLEYTLQPSKRDLRDYEQRRFALFDREQRAAIYAFTCVMGHTQAATAWARVYEAERERERTDWFELYSPIS